MGAIAAFREDIALTIIEIIDTFTFYGLDIIVLAAVTCLLVQLLKVLIFKKRQKKILTFLPFLIGSVLYAGYSALVHLSFKYLADNYVLILEHGFSVGALSTVIYVWYEQFVRGKKTASATQSIIQTLIEGYVPDDKTEEIAAEIATALELDVTGDGVKKTAEILEAHRPEQVTERDVKLLAKLIIQTLAHMNVNA